MLRKLIKIIVKIFLLTITFGKWLDRITFDSISNVSLLCLTNSSTDPLVMKGIMSRGLCSATHTPSRDMTLVCSSDNMVDTSFVSCLTSVLEKNAEGKRNNINNISSFFYCLAFNCFDSDQFFSCCSFQICPENQPWLTYTMKILQSICNGIQQNTSNPDTIGMENKYTCDVSLLDYRNGVLAMLDFFVLILDIWQKFTFVLFHPIIAVSILSDFYISRVFLERQVSLYRFQEVVFAFR